MADSAILLVDEPDAEPDRIERLAGFLRADLSTRDEIEVTKVPLGALPEGARGAEGAVVGALMVTVMRAGGLKLIIQLARGWLARSPSPGRTVKVDVGGDVLELTGASEASEQQLIALFVARHG